MGLFDQVMNAIADPGREASAGQIGQILSMAQQIGQTNNTDRGTMQQAASVIGGFVRSALQEKRSSQGAAAAESLVRQGANSETDIVSQLFSANQQQQMLAAVSQKTGLDASQVQEMLPVLIPMVMKLLNQGSTKASPQADTQESDNPLLSAFLDSDGDVMSMLAT